MKTKEKRINEAWDECMKKEEPFKREFLEKIKPFEEEYLKKVEQINKEKE